MTKDEFNRYLEKNYEELFNRLFKYCFSLTNDKEEAEDVIQETFLKAIQYLDTFNYGNIEVWLYTIAKRLYLYKLARRKITKNISYNEEQSDEIENDLEEKVLSSLEKENFRDNIMKNIESLPQKQRELILYIDYLNFSYSETANILGVPLGSVKSGLYHARKALKEIIENRRNNNN